MIGERSLPDAYCPVCNSGVPARLVAVDIDGIPDKEEWRCWAGHLFLRDAAAEQQWEAAENWGSEP